MEMKKINTIIAMLILIFMSGLTSADPNAQPGAVFATDSSGDDENIYPGTAIYITGHSLTHETPFRWEIYDMEADCPGGTIPGVGCGEKLSEGSGGSTNDEGYITPPYPTGWSIPEPDYGGHDYKLVVTFGPVDECHYAEFYVKKDSFDPIPEIATAGLLTLGILGLVILRKYKK